MRSRSADYWKKLLLEATLSTDSELVEDRHEVVSFRNMLNALYDGVPPQTAASSALANTSDDGSKRLQPQLRTPRSCSAKDRKGSEIS